MYKIELINEGVVDIIHHSHPNANKVISCDIDEAINTVSELNCVIPVSTNTTINLFKTMIVLTDLKTNEDVFTGRIISSKEAMSSDGSFTKEIKAESMLGILNDRYVREYIKTATVKSALTTFLSNAGTWNGYSFRAGNVEDYEEEITFEVNYETVLSAVLNLAEASSRQISLRMVNKVIYIDFVKNISTAPIQTIQMGINMLSITKDLDATEFATRVIPIATDEEGNKLTIKKVNNNKDYIDDSEMIDKYGVIEMVVEDTGTIKDAKTLLKWSKSQLNYYKSIKLVLECSAIDLSFLSGNTIHNRFNLGDQLQIINNTLGINAVVRVVEKSWSIYDAYNPQLSLSSRKFTATDQIIDIRNRQRIKNRASVLNTQYIAFEDNITSSKPLESKFNLSGSYLDAYIEITTDRYRFYNEAGESYTTYPKAVKIYINNNLVGNINDAELPENVSFNISDYLTSGTNILRITTSRNGRVKGTINIKSRV